MQTHYNTTVGRCQECDAEILRDVSPSGKERPWHTKKLENQYISLAYETVNPAKAARLNDCAQVLQFARAGGQMRLKSANFCRVRLCPICAWRRSLKVQAHMHRILEAAESYNLRYIMVTLTLRNCEPGALSASLDLLMGGFKRLMKRKRYSDVVVGWYRGVEVTHNVEADTYHPHIHALFAVKPSYFRGDKYVSQAQLAQDWRECCKLRYNPVVDIRTIKAQGSKTLIKAVNEVAKYTVKSADIIVFDDWDLTVETVRLLDTALERRRFCAFGGLFKDLHARLNLDDVEDGDLINIDGEEKGEDDDNSIYYFWHTGYSRYLKG